MVPTTVPTQIDIRQRARRKGDKTSPHGRFWASQIPGPFPSVSIPIPSGFLLRLLRAEIMLMVPIYMIVTAALTASSLISSSLEIGIVIWRVDFSILWSRLMVGVRDTRDGSFEIQSRTTWDFSRR